MNHKAHLIAGVVSGLLVAGILVNYTNAELAVVGGVTCFLGSEFPDLDTDSIPSRMTARFSFGLSLTLYFFGMLHYSALIGLVFMLIKCQPHRGITHSPLLPFGLIITAVVLNFNNNLFYALLLWCFAVGLTAHNIVDSRILFKLGKHF